MRTAVALVALLATASTCESSCENRDFTTIEVVPIDLKPGEEILDETFNPYSGRMTVDFVVTNESTTPFELTLTAEDIRSVSVTADAGVPDAGAAPEPSPAYQPAQRQLTLAVGEQAIGIFGEDELASGIGVRVLATCEGSRPCLGTLEYTVLVTQHACRSDSQCGSGTKCDTSIGRCVGDVCASDSECPSGQICDALAGDSGRCSEVAWICSVVGLNAPIREDGWWVAVLILALGLAAGRRRR